jgi:ABC-type nitrate/sulfonate/bicarbonate transport system substrate-binding protein
MIKALEQAIQKVRALPEEKQQLAAELLEELAADVAPYNLSPEERDAVRDGLAQADRGEFASDADVEKLLRRSWE